MSVETGETEVAHGDAQNDLEFLMEHTRDIVYWADADRRVTWVTPTVATILGWSPEEVIGTVMSDLMHPEDRVRLERELLPDRDVVLDRRLAAWHLVRLRSRDGRYLWMSASAEQVVDPRGHVTGMIGTFQDVDALIRAREDLRADRARLRDILDAMLDPHVLATGMRDPSGELVDFAVVDVNEAACTYLELSREDVVGRSIRSLEPAVETTGLLRKLKEVLDTGSSVALDSFRFPATQPGGEDRCLDIRATHVDDTVSILWRDVTDRELAVEALRSSEEHYRLLAENSTDVVVRLRDERVVWVSPSLTRMLDWTPTEWVGRCYSEFVHPADLNSFAVGQDATLEGEAVIFEYRMRAKDLTYHWVEAHASPYVGADGIRDGLVESFRTIDGEVKARIELDRRARFDHLTGLLNRQEALDHLEAMAGHARRSGDETAVLFIDVDRLKQVNDGFGHAAGDDLLRQVAARIHASIREGDIAARIGGDELVVILERVRDSADADRIAEKIRAAVAEPMTVDGHPIAASVSIGVATLLHGESVESLIARADDAMYRAKQDGRGRVVVVGARPALIPVGPARAEAVDGRVDSA